MKYGQLPKRRRSGEGAVGKVSLFPFMAVLLCTMGILIVLLIIIAKTARDRALLSQRANLSSLVFVEDMCFESLEDAMKTLTEEAENAEWLAEGMREASEADILEAKKYRERLAVEEELIRQLKDEAEQLRNTLRELAQRKDGSRGDAVELEKTLARKENELREKIAAIEKLKQSPKEKKKAYAIVPFQGRNKTQRYPIYIICNSDSIEIQPEGIRLQPIDFAAAGIQRGAHLNPLDSAIRAATLYLRETGKIAQDEEAYPLLLARPSGVETYAVAWQFMVQSGNDFGYELIEEDQEVVYPKPSEEMKQRMAVQVDRTRGEISDLFTLLSRQGGGRQEGTLHRFGAGARYQKVEDGGTPNEWVYGTHDPKSARGQAEIAREVQQNASIGGNGLSPRNGTVVAATPQGMSGQNGFTIPNPTPSEPGMPYGGQIGGGQAATGQGGFVGGSQVGTTGQNEWQTSGEVRPVGGNFGDASSGFIIPNPNEIRPENQTAASSQPNQNNQNNIQNTQNSPNGQYVQGGQYPQGGTVTQGTSDYQPGEPYPPYQVYQPNQDGQQFGQQQSQQPNQQQGQPSASGAGSDGGSMNSSASATASASGFSGGSGSFADAKGSNWAVQGYEFRAIEVRRTVRIRIEPNRLVLLKQAGLFGEQTVKIENSFKDASLEFASKLLDFTENWGSAGENRYWRPVLKVNIAPGAENRYNDFARLMQNSGFVLEKE